MRRLSPPRTTRRAHGVSYGGCLLYVVIGASAVLTGIIKTVLYFV